MSEGGLDRRTRLLLAVAVIVGAAFLGISVVRTPWLPVAFVLALLVGWSAIDRALRPVLAALLFLGFMNAVPWFDLSTFAFPAGLRYDDITMGLLLLLSVAWTSGVKRGTPIWRLRTLLVAIAAYWVFVVIQTVVTGSGTLMLTVLYGRDLLAIVMALAFAYVGRSERDTSVFLGVVLSIACLYSLAHIVQVFVGVDTSLLTHPYKVSTIAGASRIFFRASDMIVPLLLISLGRALIVEEGAKRTAYFVVAGILVVDVLALLTRANYLGLILAAIVGGLILGRVRTTRAESRVVVALVVTSIVAFGVWLVTGSRALFAKFSSTSVAVRFFATSSDLTSGGGTFGYRVGVYQSMLAFLGSRWVTGAGFLHPAENYIASLPSGAIRNVDTGLLGVLMTMGIVGVVMIAWPLVRATRMGFVSLSDDRAWVRATGWAIVCYAAWVLITSFSLGFLSGGSGLGATALMVGFMTGARQAAEEKA